MDRRIIVIGSSNIDLIMKMDHLPARDESVPNAEFMQVYGGKGANQAVAAARAGGNVHFVNCVGDDPYAEAMVKSWTESGVNVDNVFREKNVSSGTALIMIGEGGHNYLSVAPGANGLLSADRIRGLKDLIAGADYILMQFEIPAETIQAVIGAAGEAGVPLIWNYAPAGDFDCGQLENVDIFVVNEPEAAMVAGIEVTDTASGVRAAEKLCEFGINTAIVTLGEQGSVIAVREPAETFHVEAFPVKAVDTTAAGDTYCGCLAVALAEGKTFREAVRFAGAAAALSVQKMGAQPSTPRRKDIDSFLEQNS